MKLKFVKDNTWPHSPLDALDYSGLSHNEWLAMREALDTIGGSDMGALMGLNPYVSPRLLFYRLAGAAPPRRQEDRLHLAMGHLMEYTIAQAWSCYVPDEGEFARRILALTTGEEVDRLGHYETCERTLIAKELLPWLHANIDFRIRHIDASTRPWLDADINDGILECKNISARNADRYEEGLPPYYTPQVLTYMAITGVDYAELVAIVGGNRMAIKPFFRHDYDRDILLLIERSYEFIAAVRAARERIAEIGGPLWDEAGTLTAAGEQAIAWIDPLVPDWVDDVTDEYQQFLTQRHQLTLDVRIEVRDDEPLATMAREVLELKAAVKKRDELKRRIRDIMARRGASIAESPSVRISWGTQLRIAQKDKKENA